MILPGVAMPSMFMNVLVLVSVISEIIYDDSTFTEASGVVRPDEPVGERFRRPSQDGDIRSDEHEGGAGLDVAIGRRRGEGIHAGGLAGLHGRADRPEHAGDDLGMLLLPQEAHRRSEV